MANFCNQKEQRITEVTIQNALDTGAKATTIGIWGYTDFDGKPLQILSTPYLSVKKGAIKGKVQYYDISGFHPGDWTLDAITEGGATWDTLVVHVKGRQLEIGYVPYDVIQAAKSSQFRWKVPASITIAQWAVESDWGRKMPANSNNPFGIKSMGDQASVSASTEEEVDGKRITIKSGFRKFDSISQAFDEHGRLLATAPQYKHAMTLVDDPDAFADALTGVYATASNYGSVLKSFMKRFHFYEYNQSS